MNNTPAPTYIPDRGDIIWLRLTAASHSPENVGQSPVLVLSPLSYNQATGLLLACPITSQTKDYPFEIPIAQGLIDGTALADQIISLGWTSRNPKLIFKASPDTTNSALHRIKLLLS